MHVDLYVQHMLAGAAVLAACMCVGACMQDATYDMYGGGGGRKSSVPGGDSGDPGS